MKYIIYLVGQISIDDSRTYKWRYNVENFFDEEENFEILNPCGNSFNSSKLKDNQGKDTDRKKLYQTKGIDILPTKDNNYVKQSDMAIANLYQYDINKPIIGSCFELAWYSIEPSKTVIGVHPNPTEDIICMHPFIKKSITTWVKDEHEACELIKYYF